VGSVGAAELVVAGNPALRRKSCTSPGTIKMRRAVQKLGLIRRFNLSAEAGVANTAATDGSIRSETGAGTSSRVARAASSRAQKQQRRLARAMDAYVREQSNLYDYGSKRLVAVEGDEKLPWYLLRPESTWKLLWDVIVLMLVAYAAFVVPIRIGFDTLPSK